MKLEKKFIITPNCCLLVNQAPQLVQKAMSYKSVIQICYGEYRLNAKSLLGVLLLKVNVGDTVMLSAEGEDAQDAIAALEKMM